MIKVDPPHSDWRGVLTVNMTRKRARPKLPDKFWLNQRFAQILQFAGD